MHTYVLICVHTQGHLHMKIRRHMCS